jgi:hypothetical protein
MYPLVAEEPLFGDTVYSSRIMPLIAEDRRRIDLVGLERREVRVLQGEEDEPTCGQLMRRAKAQPGVGPRSRFAFFEARDRYVVTAWADLEPGRIRLGWYQDTFVAFFNRDLELIEKRSW